MQHTLREFIRRYNEDNGATIILTSHNMADVASLTPRVILIDKGKLAFDGALDELVRRTRPEKRLVLRLAAHVDRAELAALGTVVRANEGVAELTVPQADVSRVVARALAVLPVTDLNVTDPPLEEVMAQVFGRTRAQEPA
jgi:ABC-2 type transport system ATP-binding protein